MSKRTAVLIALGALLAPVVFWLAAEHAGAPQAGGEYTAPGLEPLSLDAATGEAFRLAPALLLAVYDAFGQTTEGAVYDTLAVVADGEALETLYLERAGAMAGGGLTETDQTIHEMRVIGLDTRRSGETLQMDAQWEVVGIVGHSEHQHVRGNAYRANLSVAPVDGAWKIVAFELLEVDRSRTGTLSDTQDSTE